MTGNGKLCECGCGGLAPIARDTNNKKGIIRGQSLRYIRGHSLRGRTGEKSGRWNGGNCKSSGIYHNSKTLIHGHPRSDTNGYVYDHILLAEKAFGGPLPPKVEVHHHTKEQLVICQDRAYHKLLHMRQRALKAGGKANWRKCKYCKQYDAPENLTFWLGQSPLHKECKRIYDRIRKFKKREKIYEAVIKTG